MMLYILFVATLNLAVGFALGSRLKVGAVTFRLPVPSLRRSGPRVDDFDDDELLTRPAEATTPESQPEPQADPEPTPPSEPAAKAGPAEESAPSAEPVNVMAGLASLREKLASASVELKLSEQDPEAFNDCASRLQEANHDYVDHATAAADTLKEQGAEQAGEVVAKGAEESAKLSGELDELLEGELTDEKRAEVIKQASAISENASKTQVAGEAAIDEGGEAPSSDPEPAPAEAAAEEIAEEEVAEGDEPAPAEGGRDPVTSEELFDQIEAALKEAEDDRPRIVASLTADPIEGHESDAELYEALARDIDALLGEVLEEGEAFAAGSLSVVGRPLLSFGEESFEVASNKIEKIRQSFEATSFRWGEESLNATVTCAMVEVRSGASRDEVEGQLSLALEESERVGHNRTYHHDGAFPTALPTLSLEPIRRTVELK